MPRILYLQPTFDTHGPRNIRTFNMLKYLKHDYDITLVCLETFEKPRIMDGVKVIRIPLSFSSKYIFNKGIANVKLKGIGLFFSRVFNLLFNSNHFPDVYKIEHDKILDALEKESGFDIIMASIFPFSNSELAIKIREKYYPNAKIVYDIGDPFSNNATRNVKNASKRLKYEKEVVAEADKLVVTNEATKNYYQDFGFPAEDIYVVPQGVDVEGFSKAQSTLETETISMIYAGTFYKKLRDHSAFVQAVNALDLPNHKITMFGPPQDLGFQCKHTSISLNSRVPQHELVSKYGESNVLLYFDNAYGIQSSGKIYELLALKKPILFIYSNDDSTVKKECEHYPNIIFIKNEYEDLKDKLSQLDELLNGLSFDYEIESFSWRNRASRFQNVFQSFAKPRVKESIGG